LTYTAMIERDHDRHHGFEQGAELSGDPEHAFDQ
jgi:hypothetical protein